MNTVDFTTRYNKLNERQKEAVNAIDGPVMVIAGPGTGKTELLSMRVANILQKTDTLPENILCLTFTESGASAMRERLAQIIGSDAYKVAIHTFHSFGTEIINQNGEYFYHGASFRPASELNTYELLRSIFDSLEFSNPLSAKLNGEYTYLNDTLTVISELKKSGLTNEELLQLLDANESVVDSIEADLADVFSSRISKSSIDRLTPIAAKLANIPAQPLPPEISPLSNVLALSLAHAVDEAADQESTKPITAWKNRHLEKDEAGNLLFKDRRQSQKLRAVSYLYYQYLIKMQEAELYDFDDMVMRVVHAMEVFPDLRYNLQEKYLYIMVDEFQDTNLAQARILHNLTSTPNYDSPNIMVVGDDDQAIYSFQGAEVGNILNFRDQYEDAKIVTLTDNYRSAAVILQKARTVITQGHNRLEQYLEEIDKNLTAHHTQADATVTLTEYQHIEDERQELVEQIKQQIAEGINPESIVVIARRHHELVDLLPYFANQDLLVNYERRDNVLESEIIVQLDLLAKIVCHIASGKIDQADALLPRLLAHPAWQYDTSLLWQLSINAHKHHGGWLEQMATTPAFVPLFEWLTETAQLTHVQPMEQVVDHLVGVPLDDSNDTFQSPLYEYFFSDNKRSEQLEEYIGYLEALRSLRAKLREYLPNQQLTLQDFTNFIDLHKRLESTITHVRRRSDTAQAVNLMTAHKSKGLEFDHVYIVGAIDSSWGEQVRRRARLISYPENLQIRPSGDTFDERLRLFFVAMTRARTTLAISYSTSDTNGKSTLPASFLVSDQWQPIQAEIQKTTTQSIDQLQQDWYQPYVTLAPNDMKQLLAHTLENYKLSVTHLTSFLDISRGGPEYFLVNNLLHFPKSKHPSAVYGSAIHDTLQRAHGHLTATSKRKPIEDVLQDFEQSLANYRLPDTELQAYTQRGMASLSAFLKAKYDTFAEQQKVELNFAYQQSHVGSALITGALDLVDISEKTREITVTDYKTGAPSAKWQGKTDSEKIKLHKYRQQLLFYKLMCENSRDYANYIVTSGVLQFVEPSPKGNIYELELSFQQDELDQFAKLVERVYELIVGLRLPDVSAYSNDYKGLLAFEADIIDGKY